MPKAKMSTLSRVYQQLSIVETTRLINGPVLGHVNVNLCHSQQCKAFRLRRFTAGHNVVPQLEEQQARAVQGNGASVSLADISKPVPFNTHQLVCRLQSKGAEYSTDHVMSHVIY